MAGVENLWNHLASWDDSCSIPSKHAIKQALRDSAFGPDAVAEWIEFGAGVYRRNLIHRTSCFEVLLLCWRSGQRSPIHDHSGSICGVRVIAGTATETIYRASPCGSLYPVRSRGLEAGSVTVAQDVDIHQMSNLAPPGDDLITLHIYAPPLAAMRVYSLRETTLADHDLLAALRLKERSRSSQMKVAQVRSSNTPRRVSKVTR